MCRSENVKQSEMDESGQWEQCLCLCGEVGAQFACLWSRALGRYKEREV